MAVDRGSLDYTIRVRDEFSNQITRFRTQVRELQQGLNQARQRGQSRGGANSEKAEERAALQRLRRIDAAEKAQQRRAAEAARLRRQIGRDEVEQARRLQAEITKQNKFEAERARILKAQRAETQKNAAAAQQAQQAEERAARARRRAARDAELSARRAQVAQQRLNRELGITEGTANRISFTFRRLFGILAAFAAARQGIAAFNGLVIGGVQFNAQLDQSRIGLAGILSSVADIRNGQGELVRGAEAFAQAQIIASQQQEKLQDDALRTTASYRELLDVFQIALGPGLAQQLNVDEIRELSVLISQAATSVGIEQRQLSEEVRSLLSGRLRPGQSRLGSDILGLTGEDIRGFQEAGRLFPELRERLIGFNESAEEAAQRLTGLLPRIRDAFDRVAGAAAADFTSNLEEQLRGLFDLLTEVDVEGRITPDPGAIAAFQAVFDLLGGLVERAGDFLQSLDFFEVARDVQAFADAAAGALDILISVVGNAFSAISTVVAALAPLAGIASELAPLVGIFVQVRVTLFLISGIATRIVAAFVSMVPAATNVAVQMTDIERRAALAQRAVRGITLGLGAAFLAAQPIVESIFDVEVSAGNAARIVGLSLVNAFQNAVTEIRVLGAELGSIFGVFNKEIRESEGVVGSFLNDIGAGVIAFGQGVAELTGDTTAAAGLGALLERNILRQDDIARQAGEDRVNSEFELRERLRREQEDRNKQFAKELGDLLAEGTRGAGLDESFARRAEQVRKALEQATRDAENQGPTASPRDVDPTPQQVDEVRQLQAALAIRQADLRVQQDIQRIQAQELPAVSEAAAIATVRAQALRQQLIVVRQRNAEELAIAAREVGAARGAKAQQLAQERLNALKGEQTLKEDEILLKIAEQEELFRKQRQIAEGSLIEGFGEGFTAVLEQWNSAFLAAVNIAQGVIQQFASFLTNTIVQGFVNVGRTGEIESFFDNIEELAGQFLQNVAQLILQQLIQLAIARAILGVPAPAGGGAATGLGLAEGGEVPGRGPTIPRPAGLDPRDTVNAWLQPGEWVHRLDAVRKYGSDVMDALNRGLIDPGALRALAGLGGKARMRAADARRRRGYQTGGLVTSAVNQVRATERADTGDQRGSEPSDVARPAFIVASNQAAEQFLNGGRDGVLQFFEENAADIDGILSQSRQS